MLCSVADVTVLELSIELSRIQLSHPLQLEAVAALLKYCPCCPPEPLLLCAQSRLMLLAIAVACDLATLLCASGDPSNTMVSIGRHSPCP